MNISRRDELELIDPVCGKTASVFSQYVDSHGGALFFFCGKACRERFIENPAQFVSLNMPESDAIAVTPDVDMPEVHEGSIQVDRISPNFRDSERELEHRLQSRGLRGWAVSWLLAWRERRYAVRISRELLALYRSVSVAHPELSDRERYGLAVMARDKCDATTANTILECAEESFASWPVSRELTLCDVAHYLAVKEFIANHDGTSGTHSDIRHVVIARIPHDLCRLKKRID